MRNKRGGNCVNSIREVAKIFNVTERTVQRWIANGDIKYIKVGGTVRITDEEIKRIKDGNN